jgi:hypothetical protein
MVIVWQWVSLLIKLQPVTSRLIRDGQNLMINLHGEQQ